MPRERAQVQWRDLADSGRLLRRLPPRTESRCQARWTVLAETDLGGSCHRSSRPCGTRHEQSPILSQFEALDVAAERVHEYRVGGDWASVSKGAVLELSLLGRLVRVGPSAAGTLVERRQ
jgi:hypothetical protein